MYKNIILKEKNVFEENNNLYLRLIYEFEDKRGVHELIIPKIELEISTNRLPVIKDRPVFTLYSSAREYEILRDSDTFKLLQDYVINTIREKTRELTLADIENKLGYKINLVSEKGNNTNEDRN